MKIIKRPPPHSPDAAEVAKLNGFMNLLDEATFDELRAGIAGWGAFTDGQVQQHVQDADLYDTER